MKYKIIELWDVNQDRFVKLVNEAIAEGWEPLGGVSIATYHEQTGYAQVVVKREDKEAEK